jgi:sugar (pentulose or hexulose) kinase
MPIVLGVDIGTTTLTALAVDTTSGEILARCTKPHEAESTRTEDKARGRSEWDARRMTAETCECLRGVAEQMAERRREFAGIGITGQQHGVVIVGDDLSPLTPLINWQDRRGEEIHPGTPRTFVQEAIRLVGEDAPARTGCRLAAGYLAVTLFWMKRRGILPAAGKACFIVDHFASLLTGRQPVTDATCAASSGVFHLTAGDWDAESIAALGLPDRLFPDVQPSGSRLGELVPATAVATGLPAGLPVFVGIGDNQASFLGSVPDRAASVLVNVGTGGQVAAHTEAFVYDPLLETRPFPGGGYLLVSAGLAGGRSYAVLERFFRDVGERLFDQSVGPLYERMNRLAAGVPRGCDGLRCEPFFTGTRDNPELRASWTGVSAENFRVAPITRALLEGMARAFRSGYERIGRHLSSPRQRLIGAGNGLRENPVLAGIVSEEFGLPLAVPRHREEAAFGAALIAAVGDGIFPDLDVAGRLVRLTG